MDNEIRQDDLQKRFESFENFVFILNKILSARYNGDKTEISQNELLPTILECEFKTIETWIEKIDRSWFEFKREFYIQNRSLKESFDPSEQSIENVSSLCYTSESSIR